MRLLCVSLLAVTSLGSCSSMSENKETSIEDIYGKLSPARTRAARAADNLLERLPVSQIKDCNSIFQVKNHTERKKTDYLQTRFMTTVYDMASQKWNYYNLTEIASTARRKRLNQMTEADRLNEQVVNGRAWARYRKNGNAAVILTELKAETKACSDEVQVSYELLGQELYS